MESGFHPPASRRRPMNGTGTKNGAVSRDGHGPTNLLGLKHGHAAKIGLAATNGHTPTNGHVAKIGHGAANGHATRPGDVARELISALWERSVPLISDRLHGLDIACEAAVVGRLSPIMRRGAMDTAHKLAGSLGMFGYPRGTELAREIEQMLDYEGVVDAGLLRELVVELRGCLPL